MKQNFYFFWKKTDTFSHWFPCTFTMNDYTYNCGEQAMMHSKALHFDDYDIADQIMETSNPKIQKALGRKVRSFVSDEWDSVKEDYVYDINIAKFSQNPTLKKELLDTGDMIIAEASPYDRVWGIGLDKHNADAKNVDMWKGLNLLGYILMDVRDELKK